MAKRKSDRDEREYDFRADDFREQNDAYRHFKLWVDPAKIPPGMTYRFINYKILDIPVTGRISIMRRRGWTPVPAARHPELCADDIFNPGDSSGFINIDGSVLFERSAKMSEKAKRELAEKNASEVNNLKAVSGSRIRTLEYRTDYK